MTLVGTGLAGCAIDVDLSSSPGSAKVGKPVTFDVSVRNRTTCPVGGVVAVLVPFIPRNFIIDQIQDPNLRAALSAFVDAFCSGQDVQPPDGAGGCRLENGELICDLAPQMSLPGPFPEAAVAMTDSGDEVTCASDGAKVTCRFPHAIVEQAMAQAATSEPSIGALQCVPGANVAVCGALLLGPNETKSAQVQMNVTRPGALRNWIVSFATVRGGVCTTGVLRNRPCSDDTDCPGMVVDRCGDGICAGGTRDGFGCNTSNGNGDCSGGGTCTTCEVADDGQVLSGVACTTTTGTVDAVPAASTWGLVAMIAALGVIGTETIRRMRRTR